jgi:hypothetical protein
MLRVLLPRRVVERVELVARDMGLFFLLVVLTLSRSVTVVLGLRRALFFWPETALR